MGEVRGAFIELQPPNDTMIGEIFCDARFRYAEMFGKLRLQRIGAAPACTTAQKVPHGDAQGLAGFDVVIAGEVRIREYEDSRPHGSVVRFAEFYRRTSQQAAKLHFEKRQPGR